ncbi:MAG: family 10 glycosylhydrolase [Ruminococcus sp.]|nr:family 10 glycosylhydrolase [Ruminococcus sp.]
MNVNRITTVLAAAAMMFTALSAGRMFGDEHQIRSMAEDISSSSQAAVFPAAAAASASAAVTVTTAQTVTTTVPTAATSASSAASAKTTTAKTTVKSVSETAESVSEAEEPVPDTPPETSSETETSATTTAPPQTTTTATTTAPPEPEREIINYTQQKAMWVSLFELERMLAGRTEYSFRTAFSELCANCRDIGINTLYVHARPTGVTFYDSSLFPWSADITGTLGARPAFDPLSIAVELAHGYGLSIHAWINPYRAPTPAEIKASPNTSIVKKWYSDPAKYPEYVTYVESTRWCWMNPGIPDVRTVIAMSAAEIVKNYEVDGIHIDDYFYPTTETGFDDETYAKYGGGLSLSQWRLRNCTLTVKAIYNAVKDVDPDLVFGIAPQGNYENNYNYMYADVALWLSQPGYCDYLAPQCYFSYEQAQKPFAETMTMWASLPRDKSVSLVIGLAPAFIWEREDFYSMNGITAYQINNCFASGAGIALFRYDSLYDPPVNDPSRAAWEIAAIKKVLEQQ